MKKLFSKIFNLNTGTFIKELVYYYEGKAYVGYIVCRGYILFGLFGYDRLEYCLTKKEAENSIFLKHFPK